MAAINSLSHNVMSVNTDGVAVLYQTCLVGWLVFNGTFNIDTLHLAQRVKIMIELQPLHNAIETKKLVFGKIISVNKRSPYSCLSSQSCGYGTGILNLQYLCTNFILINK